MEEERERKIAWLEKRRDEMHKHVEKLESLRNIDRSEETLLELRFAKKEKLRLKDMIEWMKSTEKEKS